MPSWIIHDIKSPRDYGYKVGGSVTLINFAGMICVAKTRTLIHSVKGGRLHEPKVTSSLTVITIAVGNYSVT